MKTTTKIAILDLTHGGIIIAKKYMELGYSVIGVDVYNTIKDQSAIGIPISKVPVDVKDYDLIVAPVHLDTDYPSLKLATVNNIPVITHHSAVKDILKNYLGTSKIKTIEITGVKAKTSTAILLAEILSKKEKVLLHTTHGLQYWNNGNPKLIKKGLSITPASILQVVDIMKHYNLNPDFLISEVSLGGTGFADIGVITTLSPDYKIANHKKNASEAKMQIIKNAKEGSTVIVNASDKINLKNNNLKIITFGDNGEVQYKEFKGNIKLSYWNGEINFTPNPNYEITSYKTAILCAVTVALSLGIDSHIIQSVLTGFTGVQGRMKQTLWNGRILIDNSNSGMNVDSAKNALDYALNLTPYPLPLTPKIVMVFGEEAYNVCEGINLEKAKQFIEQSPIELILVGDRVHAINRTRQRFKSCAKSLEEGLDIAMNLTNEGDVIISCVKCFR
ncbi:MAG TPA: coenzyme F430 synthase [Methanosarcinales archaeon]|nr:coenzyme F430 synthase [Methanosarcinales archaeon]